MTNEERRIQYMERNIKLSPSLIALTWDVIFVWTISTLYFTQVKGLSNAETVMLDSILMFSGCLMCVPVTRLFQNIKPITATRIGTAGYGIYLLLCIFGNSYPLFMLAQFFLAFGYAVNSVKTNSVLTDSLSVVKRDNDYQRIYGKGISLLYIIEFIGAIGITYVFDWKPEAAYWLSFAVVVITIILTFFFKDPEKFQDKNVDINSHIIENSKTEQKNKKPESFKKILASSFFIFLLIYAFFIRGVLSVTSSGLKLYLNELIYNYNLIPIWAYGYIYGISRLICAFASKYQFKFNLKWGVRTLIIINTLLVLGFLIVGLLQLLMPTSIVGIVVIILMNCVLCALRMPNQIFVNNYLQVCTSKRNIERAYSIRVMVEYLGYAAINFVYSILLTVYKDNLGLTNLTYIGIFGIPLIISLVLFIRVLCKKYAQKYTIIKPEYTED